MKKFWKILLIVTLIFTVSYLLVGYVFDFVSTTNRVRNLDLDGETIEVSEAEFINYIDEIYINADKYIGKKVIIEGFYKKNRR